MKSVPIPKYKVSIVIGIVAYKFIAIRGGSAMRISSLRRGDIVLQRQLRLEGRCMLFNAIIVCRSQCRLTRLDDVCVCPNSRCSGLCAAKSASSGQQRCVRRIAISELQKWCYRRRDALWLIKRRYMRYRFRDLMKSTSKVVQAPLVNAVDTVSLATLLFLDYISDPQGAIHASPENDSVAF